MKTSNHTPGPWEISQFDGSILGQINGSSREIIAKMPAWFNGAIAGKHATQDHLLANARLIASAPELLEALQDTKRSLESIYQLYVTAKRELNQYHGFTEDVTAFEHCISTVESARNARAAIAKATGKENQ